MKKRLLFLLFLFLLPYYFITLATSVFAVDPHLEIDPNSGVITSSGVSIDVNIDTGGQAAKSAKAVINFASDLLEVTSVTAGTFFDDVSHNIYNTNGEVVINANLSLDSMQESKTGTGTLATLTVKAKSNGTGTLVFDCTTGSSTDSNINNPTPLDIIVCASNLNGSYTLQATSASASPTASTTVGGATGTTGTGTTGTGGTTAPVPVTGVSWPTITLLITGSILFLSPLVLKLLAPK